MGRQPGMSNDPNHDATGHDPEGDLPGPLEGEELDKDPDPGAMPSEADVQAERPPDGLAPED